MASSKGNLRTSSSRRTLLRRHQRLKKRRQSEKGWVPFVVPSHPRSLVLTLYFQKRLERIERLKDDPYYIFDKEIEKPVPSTSSDVDSIPIVRLDDLMPVAPGPLCSTHRDTVVLLTSLHCSTSTTRDYPPGRFSNIATSKARVRGRQGG